MPNKHPHIIVSAVFVAVFGAGLTASVLQPMQPMSPAKSMPWAMELPRGTMGIDPVGIPAPLQLPSVDPLRQTAPMPTPHFFEEPTPTINPTVTETPAAEVQTEIREQAPMPSHDVPASETSEFVPGPIETFETFLQEPERLNTPAIETETPQQPSVEQEWQQSEPVYFGPVETAPDGRVQWEQEQKWNQTDITLGLPVPADAGANQQVTPEFPTSVGDDWLMNLPPPVGDSPVGAQDIQFVNTLQNSANEAAGEVQAFSNRTAPQGQTSANTGAPISAVQGQGTPIGGQQGNIISATATPNPTPGSTMSVTVTLKPDPNAWPLTTHYFTLYYGSIYSAFITPDVPTGCTFDALLNSIHCPTNAYPGDTFIQTVNLQLSEIIPVGTIINIWVVTNGIVTYHVTPPSEVVAAESSGAMLVGSCLVKKMPGLTGNTYVPGEPFILDVKMFGSGVPSHLSRPDDPAGPLTYPVNILMGNFPDIQTVPGTFGEYGPYMNGEHKIPLFASVGTWVQPGVITHSVQGPGFQTFTCSQTIVAASAPVAPPSPGNPPVNPQMNPPANQQVQAPPPVVSVAPIPGAPNVIGVANPVNQSVSAGGNPPAWVQAANQAILDAANAAINAPVNPPPQPVNINPPVVENPPALNQAIQNAANATIDGINAQANPPLFWNTFSQSIGTLFTTIGSWFRP